MKKDDKLKLFLATGFFLGLAPIVPGSFGALTGLAWHLVAVCAGWSDMVVRAWCLGGVLFFAALHYWLTPWAQSRWNDPDPRHFVLDEVVGYLCVPLFWVLPANSAIPVWQLALAGFIVFRIFDAIKLPIARYIDRNVHTASGVLFDDVVSAAYTAALVTGVLFFSACSPGGGRDEARGGTDGSTYRCPLERVASMDPIHSSAVYDSRAVALVYEPLLEVDYMARPYRLKPCACDLPEVSSNRLTYTFRVRDSVRFQDDPCFPGGKGREATAEDVVYSLGRLCDPANASPGKWTMDYVKSVRAADSRTVVIELKKPFHVFPWLMAMAYASVVPHEALETYGAKFGEHAVGTGPYRLTEWWRNYRMVFTRDAAWYGWPETANPAPYDKIEYVVVGDASTQWLMFLGKEVDSLRGVDRNNWDAVVGKDGKLVPSLAAQGVRLLSASTLQVMYVGVNMDDPLLGKNKKLRQALNCAFDAPAWKQFLNGRAEPADGPLPPGVNGRLETPFAYAFNVEKAKKLLEEAGFPNGIDPKTGKRLVIPIALGRADQGAREEVELLQSFYDRVGIRLEPQFMTWAAYLKAVSDGHTTLFMLGWTGDYPDAENFLQLFHSKNCSPGANHGNYRNPEFDKCYDEAMAATTPEARQAAWARAQEIVREDCPWIYLYFPKAYSILWDHVGNFHLTDFPYGAEKHFRVGK